MVFQEPGALCGFSVARASGWLALGVVLQEPEELWVVFQEPDALRVVFRFPEPLGGWCSELFCRSQRSSVWFFRSQEYSMLP